MTNTRIVLTIVLVMVLLLLGMAMGSEASAQVETVPQPTEPCCILLTDTYLPFIRQDRGIDFPPDIP
jgi:lipopolysaccharide export system protein LptC